MLPVYEAISFEQRLVKGGRTKPLIVKVLVEDKLASYVVKLFSKNEVTNHYSVAKEVLVSVLAAQFDIPRPDPAFVHLGSSFVHTLSQDLQAELAEKDQRLKFGCAYLEKSTVLGAAFSASAPHAEEIEMIFAFDNLIWNVDRTSRRPNLLLNDNDIHVIDHEYALGVDRPLLAELNNQQWRFPVERHCFYRFFKNKATQKKAALFETFDLYLSRLNPEVIHPYAEQLRELKHPAGDIDFLKEYLYHFKNNHRRFVTLLRGLL